MLALLFSACSSEEFSPQGPGDLVSAAAPGANASATNPDDEISAISEATNAALAAGVQIIRS